MRKLATMCELSRCLSMMSETMSRQKTYTESWRLHLALSLAFSIASQERERDFESGLEIVNACLRIIEQCKPTFWALENPRGYLRQFLGMPPFTFQPWEFGDAWTKATDIWGNYNIPKKLYTRWEDVPKLDLYTRPNRGKPNFAYLHKSAWANIPQLSYHKPETDAEFRAMTPPGFARAFFEANR